MSEAYVTQLIDLYEKSIQRIIEYQNPEFSLAISLLNTHLEMLKQARNRCDFERQLYCVNRISRTLGEIEGKMSCSDSD